MPQERIHIRKILEEYIKLQEKYKDSEKLNFRKNKVNSELEEK